MAATSGSAGWDRGCWSRRSSFAGSRDTNRFRRSSENWKLWHRLSWGCQTEKGVVEWITRESLLSTEFRAFPRAAQQCNSSTDLGTPRFIHPFYVSPCGVLLSIDCVAGSDVRAPNLDDKPTRGSACAPEGSPAPRKLPIFVDIALYRAGVTTDRLGHFGGLATTCGLVFSGPRTRKCNGPTQYRTTGKVPDALSS